MISLYLSGLGFWLEKIDSLAVIEFQVVANLRVVIGLGFFQSFD